jgi:hypothetical protein
MVQKPQVKLFKNVKKIMKIGQKTLPGEYGFAKIFKFEPCLFEIQVLKVKKGQKVNNGPKVSFWIFLL